MDIALSVVNTCCLGTRQLTVNNTCLVIAYDVLKPPCMAATVAYSNPMRPRPIVVACIYTVWTTSTRPRLLIVRWGVLVNSQLTTPALLLHMTYSNRLVWPQQWQNTQTRCADGLLLLHAYIQCGLLLRARGC